MCWIPTALTPEARRSAFFKVTLLPERMRNGFADGGFTILGPTFKFAQYGSVLTDQNVAREAIHLKGSIQGTVLAVIHLGPRHVVFADKPVPFLSGIAFVHADNRHSGSIDACGQVLQQRQRCAAGRAPRAPEIQQNNLAAELVEADFFSAAQFRGELRSVVPANAAGIGNEFLNFTCSG